MTIKEFAKCCLTELPISILELRKTKEKPFNIVEAKRFEDAYSLFLASLENENNYFNKKVVWFSEDLENQVMKVRVK